MNDMQQRIMAAIQRYLYFDDGDGDQIYEGIINPKELAQAITDELGFVREQRQLRESYGYYAYPPEYRWVSGWTFVQ